MIPRGIHRRSEATMPVEVLCRNPSCDASYGVDESVVGHNVRCKKCGHKFVAVEKPSEPPTRGKSAVYLAYDDDLDRPVALKFPNTSGMHEAEILERFKREAKAKELSSLVFRRQ